MTAGQFHRPKAAEVVNAFERIRHETPSIFCTAKDLGDQARQQARQAGGGQAAIQASKDRLNEIIRRTRVAKQQIAYSRAKGGSGVR